MAADCGKVSKRARMAAMVTSKEPEVCEHCGKSLAYLGFTGFGMRARTHRSRCAAAKAVGGSTSPPASPQAGRPEAHADAESPLPSPQRGSQKQPAGAAGQPGEAVVAAMPAKAEVAKELDQDVPIDAACSPSFSGEVDYLKIAAAFDADGASTAGTNGTCSSPLRETDESAETALAYRPEVRRCSESPHESELPSSSVTPAAENATIASGACSSTEEEVDIPTASATVSEIVADATETTEALVVDSGNVCHSPAPIDLQRCMGTLAEVDVPATSSTAEAEVVDTDTAAVVAQGDLGTSTVDELAAVSAVSPAAAPQSPRPYAASTPAASARSRSSSASAYSARSCSPSDGGFVTEAASPALATPQRTLPLPPVGTTPTGRPSLLARLQAAGFETSEEAAAVGSLSRPSSRASSTRSTRSGGRGSSKPLRDVA